MASKTTDDAPQGKGAAQMQQHDKSTGETPARTIAMPLPSEATPRSGVRSLDSVSARMPARRHVPPPPRPEIMSRPKLGAPARDVEAAKPPAPKPIEPEAPKASFQPENAPGDDASEQTQIFRPNLSDPSLRRSAAPTAPPPVGLTANELLFPKEPKVPADIARLGAQPRHAAAEGDFSSVAEEQTCTYNAATLEHLLHGNDPAPNTIASAADDVTRIGAVPIETLATAQGRALNKGVGHEDVTRVYEMVEPSSSGVSTSPGTRAKLSPELLPPTIVVRDETPRSSRWGWSLAIALCVATASVGWMNRTSVRAHYAVLQASFLRGIGRSAPVRAPNPVNPVSSIEISISVSPPNAVLKLDGVVVPNPLVLRRPPDRQSHTLDAEAPGHAPLKRDLQFARDLTVFLSLAREPEAPRGAVEPVEAASQQAPTPTPREVKVTRARPAKTADAAAPSADSANSQPSNCTVPYTVDAAGIKTFKPECL